MIEGDGARWGERDVVLKGEGEEQKKEEEAVEADEGNERERERVTTRCVCLLKGKSFQGLKRW